MQQTAASTSTETTAPAEPAHKGGLPQFDFAFWPGQIVWLLITFVVLYIVLARVLLPRVRTTIVDREAKITGDMEAARRLRDEADAQARATHADLADARARAQKTATDAKARSQAEATARQAELETELNARLEAAEGRIRQSRDSAMTQVRGVAAETAGVIAERLTGVAPAPGEVDAALNALSPARA